jgi:DNA-binding winged helix-turn-helix (wHTH) protein
MKPAGKVIEFGPFRYDPGQHVLFREGEIVPLAPKAVDTLHALLALAGWVYLQFYAPSAYLPRRAA